VIHPGFQTLAAGNQVKMRGIHGNLRKVGISVAMFVATMTMGVESSSQGAIGKSNG